MADAGPSKGFLSRMYEMYVSGKKKKKDEPTKIDPAVAAAIQKKKGDFAAGEYALKARKGESDTVEEEERKKLMKQFGISR